MRQPLTVLVFPFRLVAGLPEYGIFRRADARIDHGDLPGPRE